MTMPFIDLGMARKLFGPEIWNGDFVLIEDDVFVALSADCVGDAPTDDVHVDRSRIPHISVKAWFDWGVI